VTSESGLIEDEKFEQLTNEFAQLVLERAAPDEVVLYDETAAAYFANPVRALSGTRGDESLGFGLELMLITPFVISVSQTVLKWLAQTAVESAMKEASPSVAGYVTRLFRRNTRTTADADADVIALTSSQLHQVRTLAYDSALATGLDAEKAGLIADSTVGALITAAP